MYRELAAFPGSLSDKEMVGVLQSVVTKLIPPEYEANPSKVTVSEQCLSLYAHHFY